MNKSDIVAQPLSMRIIRLLINNELTTKEIKIRLSDVPQTTLYRHIKKMFDVGLLKIVKEEIVNGIIKKTYTFIPKDGSLGEKEMNKLSDKEYEDLFMQFISILISDFKRNFNNNKNYKKELDFVQAPLYLSKKELEEIKQALMDIIKKHIKNKKTNERNMEVLSLVFMPN